MIFGSLEAFARREDELAAARIVNYARRDRRGFKCCRRPNLLGAARESRAGEKDMSIFCEDGSR